MSTRDATKKVILGIQVEAELEPYRDIPRVSSLRHSKFDICTSEARSFERAPQLWCKPNSVPGLCTEVFKPVDDHLSRPAFAGGLIGFGECFRILFAG